MINLTPNFNFDTLRSSYCTQTSASLHIYDERLLILVKKYKSGWNHTREQRFITKPKIIKISIKLKNSLLRVFTISSRNRKKVYREITYSHEYETLKNLPEVLAAIVRLTKDEIVYNLDISTFESLILSFNFPKIYTKELKCHHIIGTDRYTKKLARTSRKKFLKRIMNRKSNSFWGTYRNYITTTTYNLTEIREALLPINKLDDHHYKLILDRTCKSPGTDVFKRIDIPNIIKIFKQDPNINLYAAHFILSDLKMMVNNFHTIIKDYPNKKEIQPIANQFYCILKLNNLKLKHDRLAKLNTKCAAYRDYIKYDLSLFSLVNNINIEGIQISFPQDSKELVEYGVFFDNCVYSYNYLFENPSLTRFVFIVSTNAEKYCVEFAKGEFVQFVSKHNKTRNPYFKKILLEQVNEAVSKSKRLNIEAKRTFHDFELLGV